MTYSKDIFNAISQIIFSVFSSVFFIPLSIILPKKRNRIVIIGRQNDLFIDNAKHFFLFLCNSATPKLDVSFLVFSRETLHLLKKKKLPVYRYPGLKSVLYLLTANLVIVDSAEWIVNGKFQLAYRSRIIQLWHGAPLKQIELPLYQQRIKKHPPLIRSFFKAYKLITGRHATNELVVSTSSFFTAKAFKPAFHAKRFINTGYPRNDILYQQVDESKLTSQAFINTDPDTIRKILAHQENGAKLILYAPTFRKELESPFTSKIFDLNRLDSFAHKNNLFVILKLHPVMAKQLHKREYSNISFYKTTGDIYPVLSLFDLLITDYSSIYFDYLLLDRPIIFFPYDYQKYIENDRSLLFDYEEMAPGYICMTQPELEKALIKTAKGDDAYRHKRKKVRDLTFTHSDDMASARLWQILRDDYLLR